MAFDMHLKFEPEIPGSSSHKKHAKEIPVLAWSWGVSNTADLHNSKTGGGGKAHVQDISVTKYVDSSSHALLLNCCVGKRMEKATLYVTNATGEQTDYLIIELSEGVIITSISTGGSGGEDRLTENLTLHFGKFEYKFQPQKPDGTPDGGLLPATYNMQAVASS